MKVTASTEGRYDAKIVVLDGYTTNPGDLDWEPLKNLGQCVIYDRTPPAETVRRASGAPVVITNKTMITAEVLARLDAVRYVGLMSTGTNAVDIQAARERGVVVCNVPAYSTASVAQLVMAHLLHHTFHVAEHAEGVRRGRWTVSEDFCYWDYPLIELAGKTMGIVGLGQIGRAVARLARAMGMEVLVCTRRPDDTPDVEFVELEELLQRCDVVSLHVPLTDQTDKLIDARRLALMKPGAFLINTGRGGLVDEQALADALNQGRLAGAGLDVLSTEPPQADNPLLSAGTCNITPHIAWATKAARARLMEVIVANVRAFLAGEPQNVVT